MHLRRGPHPVFLLRHSKKNAHPCGFASVKLMVTEGCSQANRGPRKVPQRGSSAKAFLMMLKRGHFVGYHGESVALSAPPNPAAICFWSTSLNTYVSGSVLAQNVFMPQGFALFLLLRHSKKNAPPRCGFASVKLMVTEGCSQANRGPRKVPQRSSSAKAFLMMLKRGHFVGYHGESVLLRKPPNLAALFSATFQI